jgi:hypothetical protein
MQSLKAHARGLACITHVPSHHENPPSDGFNASRPARSHGAHPLSLLAWEKLKAKSTCGATPQGDGEGGGGTSTRVVACMHRTHNELSCVSLDRSVQTRRHPPETFASHCRERRVGHVTERARHVRQQADTIGGGWPSSCPFGTCNTNESHGKNLSACLCRPRWHLGIRRSLKRQRHTYRRRGGRQRDVDKRFLRRARKVGAGQALDCTDGERVAIACHLLNHRSAMCNTMHCGSR